MPRLIDADAYADELKRREKLCFYQIENADVNATVSEVEYWSGIIGTFNEAMCVLADAPTVGGWVSVKDRLPEIGKVVLAFGTRSATTGMFQGTMINRPDVWMWKHNTPKKVTHWMPLPEPPKEET